MNYHQTLEYLFSQLPMFQRIGQAAYKANLNNTLALCEILGNPQNSFKSIHIAGTNGKGSTSHLLASILQTKGLKVGLYTSPHLKDFRERIKINGKNISRRYVIDFVKKYKKALESIEPSFFEMTFGMAIKYFSEEKIDIAIMETGMGGRLDSTNVIYPILSVITNIGMDHSKFLGNTKEKIAVEKAGIIKQNTPVIIGETQENIDTIFENIAEINGSEIFFADQKYSAANITFTGKENAKLILDIYRNNKLFFKNLRCPLLGNYQAKNIVTVFQVVELLKRKGYDIRKNNLKKAINDVIKTTGITGRWQVISKDPRTICDIGHNVDGIAEIVNQLNKTHFDKLHFVLGMVDDKEISNVLFLLPKKAVYYFCKADVPRGLSTKVLAEKAKSAGLSGEAYTSVNEALKAAQKAAKEKDLVFVGGSTFVVAEVV